MRRAQNRHNHRCNAEEKRGAGAQNDKHVHGRRLVLDRFVRGDVEAPPDAKLDGNGENHANNVAEVETG